MRGRASGDPPPLAARRRLGAGVGQRAAAAAAAPGRVAGVQPQTPTAAPATKAGAGMVRDVSRRLGFQLPARREEHSRKVRGAAKTGPPQGCMSA